MAGEGFGGWGGGVGGRMAMNERARASREGGTPAGGDREVSESRGRLLGEALIAERGVPGDSRGGGGEFRVRMWFGGNKEEGRKKREGDASSVSLDD